MQRVTLKVEGVDRVADLNEDLASVLREQLLLTGCKVRCENPCGASTVVFDGKAVTACVIPPKELSPPAKIAPIEGKGAPDDFHPLQSSVVVGFRTVRLEKVISPKLLRQPHAVARTHSLIQKQRSGIYVSDYS